MRIGRCWAPECSLVESAYIITIGRLANKSDQIDHNSGQKYFSNTMIRVKVSTDSLCCFLGNAVSINLAELVTLGALWNRTRHGIEYGSFEVPYTKPQSMPLVTKIRNHMEFKHLCFIYIFHQYFFLDLPCRFTNKLLLIQWSGCASSNCDHVCTMKKGAWTLHRKTSISYYSRSSPPR